MRKVIAALNTTLDGVFDHTAVSPDDEIHQHYSELLKNGGVMLFGRITYQLMEFWRDFLKNPTDNKALVEFAETIGRLPKIVFSHTLTDVDWASARVATRQLREEVEALKQEAGKDILVGSRSLILALLKEGLIDEFQLTVHPVLAGEGRPLFNMGNKTNLQLARTKAFACGAITLYYRPV